MAFCPGFTPFNSTCFCFCLEMQNTVFGTKPTHFANHMFPGPCCQNVLGMGEGDALVKSIDQCALP